jgi:hypothetical protein
LILIARGRPVQDFVQRSGILVTPAVRAFTAERPEVTVEVQRLEWDDQEELILSGRRYPGCVAEQPNLIIQVPRGSAIEKQLHDQPPASLTADDVLVQTGPTDARGVLEALAGEVVLALPAPEGLRRHAAELKRLLDDAGTGTAPLVVVIDAGEELLEEEVAPLVAAARTAHRMVMLRVIRPSER